MIIDTKILTDEMAEWFTDIACQFENDNEAMKMRLQDNFEKALQDIRNVVGYADMIAHGKEEDEGSSVTCPICTTTWLCKQDPSTPHVSVCPNLKCRQQWDCDHSDENEAFAT